MHENLLSNRRIRRNPTSIQVLLWRISAYLRVSGWHSNSVIVRSEHLIGRLDFFELEVIQTCYRLHCQWFGTWIKHENHLNCAYTKKYECWTCLPSVISRCHSAGPIGCNLCKMKMSRRIQKIERNGSSMIKKYHYCASFWGILVSWNSGRFSAFCPQTARSQRHSIAQPLHNPDSQYQTVAKSEATGTCSTMGPRPLRFSIFWWPGMFVLDKSLSVPHKQII